MIFSEAPEVNSSQQKSQRNRSEQALLPLQRKKNLQEGVLFALEITQSRMTQPLNQKVFSKQKLPQPQSGHNMCVSCQAWKEWASQSQQYILMIQKKLIQRQKILQDKFIQLKTCLEKQKALFRVKESQFQGQIRSNEQRFFQLTQTIKQLEEEIKIFKSTSRIQNKSGFSHHRSQYNPIKEEDDEQQQDIRTMRKAQNLNQLKVKFGNEQMNKKSQQPEKKLSFRNFHDEKLLYKEEPRKNEDNWVQTSKKLQMSPFNYEFYSQLRQPEDFNNKIQKRYNYINKQFDNQEQLQIRSEKNKHQKLEQKCLEFSDQNNYKIGNIANFYERNSVKQKNKKLIFSDNKQNFVNSKSEPYQVQKSFHNSKLSDQKSSKYQSNQKLTPTNRNSLQLEEEQHMQFQLEKERQRQMKILLQRQRQLKTDHLKKPPMQTVESKNSIQQENTYKTIKLNNNLNSVEKSRFYQTATECSFVNGMKSRVSNISYKLPNDQVTTLTSQCDERSKEKYGNPERVEDEISNVEWRKMNEEMQKLKFENQNLKSYNRVLLQKLSNSRPKKY